MIPGKDYIGVGVGAIALNDQGEVFLSQRGHKTGNERGTWEFPGGKVNFGEKMEDAIRREFREEYGMLIETITLLCVYDHILPDEEQHWISPTFIAHHIGGEPQIMESEKCSAIGWFNINRLPSPLSVITQNDVEAYLFQYNPHNKMHKRA